MGNSRPKFEGNLQGNSTRVAKDASVVPEFLTNSITQNKTLPNGNVVATSEETQAFAKKCVDKNDK